MIISDGRGETKKEEGRVNKERVREFFNKNPGSTKKACQDALNLSALTVRNHLISIEADGL